ncbi:MAG: hypothetical protein HXX10_23400 [Rhodoplanes sp.]|uniref:hypothetical protein n=1 Tax=Rhodoplanes sp. TaxID=1968906 RepID=UPI0017FD24C3|nr:hypothetical protein [Rhodoplanes sp.]NVO16982.1 hypothetical protein [Rhodoplanes sp.]
MSTVIGASTSSLLGYATGAYGQKTTGVQTAISPLVTGDTTTSTNTSATSLTLSEEAKAYLAAMSKTADNPPSGSAQARAQAARAWLDQQYQTLGISSALVDGQTAVDFSGQSRSTLAVIAADTGDLFTADETKAAATALHARFDDAMAPHAVIARHTGDYASLYAAAADYLDAAGPEERGTTAWTKQRKAVADGLAVAQASFGKAPKTGNADDPVRTMLDASATASQTPSKTQDAATIAAKARGALDAQANAAKDAGTDLVFNASQSGQKVDFQKFDNRTLATVAQNKDGQFSAEETRAAKKELDQRTRTTMLSAFTGSGGDAATRSAALIKQYTSMSAEERAVLGFGDDFTDKILKNYKTVSSIQSMLDGGSSSTSGSYF